jgi:hypothetical protein
VVVVDAATVIVGGVVGRDELEGVVVFEDDEEFVCAVELFCAEELFGIVELLFEVAFVLVLMVPLVAAFDLKYFLFFTLHATY